MLSGRHAPAHAKETCQRSLLARLFRPKGMTTRQHRPASFLGLGLGLGLGIGIGIGLGIGIGIGLGIGIGIGLGIGFRARGENCGKGPCLSDSNEGMPQLPGINALSGGCSVASDQKLASAGRTSSISTSVSYAASPGRAVPASNASANAASSTGRG